VNARTRPRNGWIALACALALAACGYSAGLRAPEGVQTVGIELFNNTSKVRDIEALVHDRVSGSLRSRVGVHVVQPSRADLVIRGRVVDYSRRSGIRSKQNKLLETGVQIEVEAELVRPARLPDQQDEVLRRVSVSDESGFRLEEPNGELDARDRVLRRIADRIVLELFAPLDYESRAATRK
jgi:hypothetical protein